MSSLIKQRLINQKKIYKKISSAGFIISKNLILEIGKFNENMNSLEDTDLSVRINLFNGIIIYPELFELLQTMNNSKVQKEINLERKVLNLLEGGCQLPLGVFCRDNELFVSYAPSEKSNCSYFKYHIQDFNGLAEKVISDLMELS